MKTNFEIVIPAKNEAVSLAALLPEIRALYPEVRITVVDDGSSADTSGVAKQHGAVVIRNSYSKGNGAAIKAGARASTAEFTVFLDADGQHRPADISRLVEQLESGHDMVVGARDETSQSSIWRGFANRFYNRLASMVTGQQILDLTSGFRAVRTRVFTQFLYLLPNGFSYPTTITMAFFRAGYSISYVTIHAEKRLSGSHINPLRDGIRFLLIIFRVGTLYSPLKLFTPLAGVIFLLGMGYYVFTYITADRFTNMSALLLTLAFLVFLIGLVSEQVTTLLYALNEKENTKH